MIKLYSSLLAEHYTCELFVLDHNINLNILKRELLAEQQLAKRAECTLEAEQQLAERAQISKPLPEIETTKRSKQKETVTKRLY